VLGSNGRVYSVSVSVLPGARGDGQPITTLIDLESGTQPAHYLTKAPEQSVVLAGSGGCGLLASLGDMVARQRGGKGFLSLAAGETVLQPARAQGAARLAVLSRSGRLLVFGLDELKRQGSGGRGLTLMDLDAKDALLSVAALTPSQHLVVGGTIRGGKTREEALRPAAQTAYVGKRARKGKPVDAGSFKPQWLAAKVDPPVAG